MRAAMARTHDPVVARRRRSGRPRTVLSRAAVTRQGETTVAPGQAYGAQARQRLFVEQEFRLAAGGRVERADHDFGARAVLVERELIEDDRKRFAYGQGGAAAEAVAGRVEGARLSGIAPVPARRQPLLGGEGVETFADHLERAIRVANRSQIAGWRDDDVIARPLRRADDPDERERNGGEPEGPCPPDGRAHRRERQKRQRKGRERPQMHRQSGGRAAESSPK